MEKRIQQIEKRVADLEKQVAAATTTSFNPQKAAEIMQKTQMKRELKRGESY